jgi:antitoxin component of MazEF toxin-antitoxin module
MHKTLTPIGDGLGLVIDPSILDQLHINGDTRLEVTIENDGIVIRPVENDVQARFIESARRMMDIHQETFRKLAEVVSQDH